MGVLKNVSAEYQSGYSAGYRVGLMKRYSKGHWVWNREKEEWYCSICGTEFNQAHEEYCCKCGTKMSEEATLK